MDKQREPYYYLDKLVSILLVDSDSKVLTMLGKVLAPLAPYRVRTARSAGEAAELLASPQRTHLCVSELGLKDSDGDEFGLLKRFAGRVSFVLYTGSDSPVKGFEAHRLGVKAMIEKAGDFDQLAFVKTLNYYALRNVINPRYGMGPDSLTTSTDVLFSKLPSFVSAWALEMNITDRELRNVWTKNLGANTKIILAIHQMFSAALSYYEKAAAPVKVYRNVVVEDQNRYRRLEEYFHCHRSVILDYIEYGNVVNFL